MSGRLNWGILGTGKIADTLAGAIAKSQMGTLVAVGSRTAEKARAFGAKYGVAEARCHSSYDALLADADVDVVYISLPNHLHAEWTIKCAQAGKHILCEKPLTTNHAEAMALIEACRYHGVFMLEAFMYRCHPQSAMIWKLVSEGVVGEVRVIEAAFAYDMGVNLGNIRQQNEAAGGGIMDVGCYAMSMARLVAGAAAGKPFADPISVAGQAFIGEESRVDEWAVGSAQFPGGILANLVAATRCGVGTRVTIHGSEGRIEVPNPWFPGRNDQTPARIIVHRKGEAEPVEHNPASATPLYANQVDLCAKHIAAGDLEAAPPAMTWADSLGQMRSLDMWRAAVGLKFDREKADAPALKMPFSNQPLKRRTQLPAGKVEGISKDVTRIVLGTMAIRDSDMPHACALLDAYYEMGGNCIDTAYIYGGGVCEKALGNWLKLRGVRDEMVIIGKGGHTPFCNVEGIERQLKESLERQQIDCFDIYLLHRDNLDLPVSAFVDCLNAQVREGRIKSFGGSNWSIDRIAEANRYAEDNGLIGFTASSPNFSLAHWNEAPWAGCINAVEPADRSWYEKTQMALFAWSSQARGFMVGLLSREDEASAASDPFIADMKRSWFNEGNWQRLDRAKQLAEKKNLTLVQVTLGYVLAQQANVFALIGPKSIEELQSSMAAADANLSPEEVAWLDLRD